VSLLSSLLFPSELGFIFFFLMMLADWLQVQMPSLPHGAGQLVVGPDAFMVAGQIPSCRLSHSGFLLIGRDRIEGFRRGFC
jgi:hypothetical protein